VLQFIGYRVNNLTEKNFTENNTAVTSTEVVIAAIFHLATHGVVTWYYRWWFHGAVHWASVLCSIHSHSWLSWSWILSMWVSLRLHSR